MLGFYKQNFTYSLLMEITFQLQNAKLIVTESASVKVHHKL